MSSSASQKACVESGVTSTKCGRPSAIHMVEMTEITKVMSDETYHISTSAAFSRVTDCTIVPIR